ncbi:MAG TPA: hypothetical protein VL043_06200, partial [Protaetiibacter sp.]|nr:hypothetical protein [Protaetiibacter sp.]
MHRRFEVIGPVTPPDDGARGCLLCGVGTLTGRLSEREMLWGDRREFGLAVLGGRGRAIGYLCPSCRVALRDAGAFGQPAIDR